MAEKHSSSVEVVNNDNMNTSLLENQIDSNIVDPTDFMLIDFNSIDTKKKEIDESNMIVSTKYNYSMLVWPPISFEEISTGPLSTISSQYLNHEKIFPREVLNEFIVDCVDNVRFDLDSDRVKVANNGIEDTSQIEVCDDFLGFLADTAENTGNAQVTYSNTVDQSHNHSIVRKLPEKSAITGIIETPAILKDKECVHSAPSAFCECDINAAVLNLSDGNMKSDVSSTSVVIEAIKAESKDNESKVELEFHDNIDEFLYSMRCHDLNVLRDAADTNDVGVKVLEVDTLEVSLTTDEVKDSDNNHSNDHKVPNTRNSLRVQTDEITGGLKKDAGPIGLEIDVGKHHTTIIERTTLNPSMPVQIDIPDTMPTPPVITYMKNIRDGQEQKSSDPNLEDTTSTTSFPTEHVTGCPQRSNVDGNQDTCLYSFGASQLKVDTFAKRLNYLNSVDKLNSPKKLCPTGEGGELLSEVICGISTTSTEVAVMKKSDIVTENAIIKDIAIIKEGIVMKECAAIDSMKASYLLATTNKAQKLQSTIFATAANKITSDDQNQLEHCDIEDVLPSEKLSYDTPKDKMSLFARLFGRKDKFSMLPCDNDHLPICCSGILIGGTCYNAFAKNAHLMENDKNLAAATTCDITNEDGEDGFVEI